MSGKLIVDLKNMPTNWGALHKQVTRYMISRILRNVVFKRITEVDRNKSYSGKMHNIMEKGIMEYISDVLGIHEIDVSEFRPESSNLKLTELLAVSTLRANVHGISQYLEWLYMEDQKFMCSIILRHLYNSPTAFVFLSMELQLLRDHMIYIVQEDQAVIKAEEVGDVCSLNTATVCEYESRIPYLLYFLRTIFATYRVDVKEIIRFLLLGKLTYSPYERKLYKVPKQCLNLLLRSFESNGVPDILHPRVEANGLTCKNEDDIEKVLRSCCDIPWDGKRPITHQGVEIKTPEVNENQKYSYMDEVYGFQNIRELAVELYNMNVIHDQRVARYDRSQVKLKMEFNVIPGLQESLLKEVQRVKDLGHPPDKEPEQSRRPRSRERSEYGRPPDKEPEQSRRPPEKDSHFKRPPSDQDNEQSKISAVSLAKEERPRTQRKEEAEPEKVETWYGTNEAIGRLVSQFSNVDFQSMPWPAGLPRLPYTLPPPLPPCDPDLARRFQVPQREMEAAQNRRNRFASHVLQVCKGIMTRVNGWKTLTAKDEQACRELDQQIQNWLIKQSGTENQVLQAVYDKWRKDNPDLARAEDSYEAELRDEESDQDYEPDTDEPYYVY